MAQNKNTIIKKGKTLIITETDIRKNIIDITVELAPNKKKNRIFITLKNSESTKAIASYLNLANELYKSCLQISLISSENHIITLLGSSRSLVAILFKENYIS